MIGHASEEQLALCAWGDLPVGESSVVGAHVQDCAECQSALAEFRDAQRLVVGSLIDPDLEDLVQVRERVAAKLRFPSRRERRSWWWLAGAAAALALFSVLVPWQRPAVVMRRTAPVIARSMAGQVPPTAPPQVEPRHVVRVLSRGTHARAREAGIRGIVLMARADEGQILKVRTADPNVVILWQSDERTTNQ